MLIKFQRCVDIINEICGRRPKNVLHIGAHIGEEALSYADAGVEKVVWVEANPELKQQLLSNIEPFNISQQVIFCPLWNSDEVITLKITNNMQSSSIFRMTKHHEYYPNIFETHSLNLRAVRYDTLAKNLGDKLITRDFDFINIDTQGAEHAILQGFGDEILRSSICAVYCEVNTEHLYESIPLMGQIDSLLFDRGYVRIITSLTENGWGDALYVRQLNERY